MKYASGKENAVTEQGNELRMSGAQHSRHTQRVVDPMLDCATDEVTSTTTRMVGGRASRDDGAASDVSANTGVPRLRYLRSPR
ncbi:hypothetical protein [Kineococcus sp. R86509]|uniref:hypothetical protein n=1 Tax=Kineococcus sp. R86509 TaxID=3093851 RepID=UPI0036D3DD55